MGIGVLVYVFWTPLRADTVEQTTIMASEALNDAKVKTQAVVLTKEIVRDVLTDEQSVVLLVEVVRRLLAKEDTHKAVALFLKSIFEDNYVQEITKKFVLEIVTDAWVHDRLLDIFKDLTLDLLKNPSTRDAMTKFLLETSTTTLQDHQLHHTTGKAVRATLWNAVSPF